jgi:acyl-coenzyme A thioesterase PaaI-like protein
MSTDTTPEIDSELETAGWVVPAGFRPVPSEDFLDTVGPVYMREDGAGGLCIASRMLERHRNQGGNVHGGMLATLADYAIGFNLLQIGPRPTRFGTVRLNIDFVSNGRIGEWHEATVTIDKAAGRVRFASCVIRGEGGRLVVRASGVFSSSTSE